MDLYFFVFFCLYILKMFYGKCVFLDWDCRKKMNIIFELKVIVFLRELELVIYLSNVLFNVLLIVIGMVKGY